MPRRQEQASQSALCLANLVREDGSFLYRFDSRTGEPLGGYNILRHAGAIWALLDAYRDFRDERLLSGARRATHYLLASSLRFYRSYASVCICEDNTIKLGGNALAALALLSVFAVTRERLLLTLAEQLCQFMLDQRREHGDLVHKRYFESGKISAFRSMYYTGEALLAILTLHELTGERRWLDAAIEIEEPLAVEGYGVAEQSHWMLYALERLARFSPSPVYSRHAAAIAAHILDNPEYLAWQRSTPIACRTEGLLAFLRQPVSGDDKDSALRARCLEQAEHNLDLQMAFRLADGAFIRGGNDRRHHEVRIDYIQHNISSLLQYSRLNQLRQPIGNLHESPAEIHRASKNQELPPTSAENFSSEKTVLWRVRDLQPILGGRWLGEVDDNLAITGVNYYAGQVQPGDLVFTTNPNTWRSTSYRDTGTIIPHLLTERQAAAVVTDRLTEQCTYPGPVLVVEDTRDALDRLGKAARSRMQGTVVAVTGSAGKTTTKELIRFLLSRQDNTQGSRKNYNHGPGVSLMLAETPPDTRFGVYEFSVDLPRVTAKKAEILRPHVAVITNIHPDHLQFYGTMEKLADQKCLLFKSLAPEGTAILNRESALHERQLKNARAAGVKNIVTVGRDKQADLWVEKCILGPESSNVSVRFHEKTATFQVGQPGMHIVMNCLCALAAVHAAGGDWLRAASDIADAPVLPRRNEIHSLPVADGDITLIDDTFSANPASIQAGLEVLGLTPLSQRGRRIAIMGEIRELGETSPQLHAALAPYVLEAGVDILFTVGHDLEGIWKCLPPDMKGKHSEDPETIADAVVKEMKAGDIVWVKGSRRSTAKLELILSAILEAGEKAPRKSSHTLLPDVLPAAGDSQPATTLKTGGRNVANAIDVLFVGDTAFGENYQDQYARAGGTNILASRGYDAPLAKMRRLLTEADLVIANLETPLTDLDKSPLQGRKTWVHRGDPLLTPQHLLANNIGVVGLANNHMFDYGEPGFQQTMDSLEQAGIQFFGGGRNLAEASRPFLWNHTLEGQEVTLAVIALYAGPSPGKDRHGVYATDDRAGLNPASMDRIGREIARIREHFPNPFVILFPHWGANYQWRTDRQASLARKMLAMGADLILGHGAHMIQELAREDRRWTVFSLGNFMFNSKGRYGKLSAPPYSAVARLRIQVVDGTLDRSLHLYPIVTDNRITDYLNRFVTEDEFGEIVTLWTDRYTGDFLRDVACNREEVGGESRFFLELRL